MRKIDPEDIVGLRFGKLFVVKHVGKRVLPGEQYSRDHYLCKCDCGKEAVVCRRHLLRGTRTSCGDCTKVFFEGDYCRYVCEDGQSFMFDYEDLEFIRSKRWHFNSNGHVFTIENGKSYSLAACLMKGGDGLLVDHRNGDSTDNRRSNLRLATLSENNRNMGLSSRNTSGFKGVSYYASRNKYRAYIKLNGNRKHLGYFETAEDAAEAYDEAARKLHGEFACVNFPREGERGCRPAEVFPLFDVYEDFEDLDAVI